MASLTLGSSAVGGLIFGVIADKLGRTRALSLSILIYSIFTFACGLAQNLWQLAIFRVLLGHRHGRRVGERRNARQRDVAGEASRQGARHHAELLGDRYGLAAIVVAIVLPRFGWRAVFFPASFQRSSPSGSPEREGTRDVDQAGIREQGSGIRGAGSSH
jgi:hypothetical protein